MSIARDARLCEATRPVTFADIVADARAQFDAQMAEVSRPFDRMLDAAMRNDGSYEIARAAFLASRETPDA